MPVTNAQAINAVAPRSLLMVPLVGSAAGNAAVGVIAAVQRQTPHRGLLVAGAVTGVLAFVITAAYHVPHNEALATVDAGSARHPTTGRPGDRGGPGRTGQPHRTG